MSVISRLFRGRKSQPKQISIDNRAVWFYQRFGSLENIIEEYSNDRAFLLANSLSEIYNPIDIVADRVSSVKYKLIEKSTEKEVKKPLRLQMLEEQINATQDLQTFIHNLVFTMLAQGGADIYRNEGNSKSKDVAFINSAWVLNPLNSYYIFNNTIPSNPFDITDLSDVIKSIRTTFINDVTINSDDVLFFADNGFSFTEMTYKSPLGASERNINNLLMVYQARFNQYKNNGGAGLLTPKQVANGEFASFTPTQRQDIIDEMNKTDGIVNGKNFIGVSGIPLDFIKTIGSIRELMPLEETLENQIKIAGVFNVSKELLPRPDNSTFTNQKDAERFLWQNTVKPYCFKVANILNQLFYIPQNQTLVPIFDEVEVLQEDRELSLKADLLELDLIKKLRELGIENKDLENRWKS